MPKTKVQKDEILAKTTDRLQKASSVVLVNMQGVKVTDLELIRDSLFAQGLQLQVAKNSLFKLALAANKVEVPTELLDQPIAMIFSYEDQVASAKLSAPFIKEIEALELVGGIMDGAFLTSSQVEALAKLPSREQLLTQLVGTLQAPISGLVNVMAGNLRGLVTVLAGIRDAKA